MKNWITKIREGMALIKEGCKENQDGSECGMCPFANYCDMLHCYHNREDVPENNPNF